MYNFNYIIVIHYPLYNFLYFIFYKIIIVYEVFVKYASYLSTILPK